MGSSLSTFEKLWAKNPTSILFARLAEAYREQGHLTRAVEVCRKGLRYRPSYSTGHMVLGRCLLQAGKVDEARQEFEKVLRLDPDHTAALWELGRLDRERGQTASALRRFRAALHVDPFSGELQKAVEALAEVAEDEPVGEPEPEVVSNSGSGNGDGVGTGGDPDPAEDEPESIVEEVGHATAEAVTAADAQPEDDDDPTGGGRNGSALTDLSTAATEHEGERSERAPVLTLTLADLYASQGFVGRAVEVLRELVERDPGETRYRERLKELTGVEDGPQTTDR